MFRGSIIVAALLLTAVTVAGAAKRARFLGPVEMDLVRVHIERLSGIRQKLPPAGPIGYVSDFDAGATFPVDELAGDLTLCQYVLLPRLLSAAPEVEWLVGSFRRPELVQEACRRRGLEEVEAFGSGIFLLRRTH